MGDSSVSCAFSGITLQNEPVVFIPLVPNKSADTYVFGAKIMAWGADSCGLYEPLTLPIRGEIGCDGTLVEISKDENTQSIEQAMGITIEEFLEYCCIGESFTLEGEEIVIN